jgi:hypothetical protein
MSGAGLGIDYWTVSTGVASRTGWSCRECKRVIGKGEAIKVRDGRKMRYFYHEGCFSGEADPRTQSNSTFNAANPGYALSESAPASKGKGKWTVRPETYGFSSTLGTCASAAAALPATVSSSVFGLPPASAPKGNPNTLAGRHHEGGGAATSGGGGGGGLLAKSGASGASSARSSLSSSTGSGAAAGAGLSSSRPGSSGRRPGSTGSGRFGR